MGSCHEICSDKTGTLTQGHMSVHAVYAGKQLYDIDDKNLQEFCLCATSGSLAQNAVWSSSAFIEIDEYRTQTAKGNMTERGIFKFLLPDAFKIMDLIATRNDSRQWNIPFSSEKKREISCYSYNGGYRVVAKGAPERILDLCDKQLSQEGFFEGITGSDKAAILDVIRKQSAKAMRGIMCCYRDFTMQEYKEFELPEDEKARDDYVAHHIAHSMTVSGIFFLQDPLRPGVTETVERLRKSGINTRMCTGDAIDTARAISINASIITREQLEDEEHSKLVCMEGNDFWEAVGGLVDVPARDKDGKPQLDSKTKEIVMTQEVGDMKRFAEIEGNLRVLARCQPKHKLCLVLGLKKLGRVVAATGDGTNDAPILKHANVGFAMDDGSDVAKNAAPIVLLDNNFNSTQTAVKYGRNIYDCTRKFLQFQLTVNFVALAIIFIGSCGLDAQPFTAV